MTLRRLLDRNQSLPEGDAAPPSPDPALAIVDDALSAFAGRTLVSGDEVLDRLLDLRNALIAATLLRDLETYEVASR